ncbi:MAG: hypothetical protein AAF558_03835 [Verrucomicrobiota bacterium]
MKQILLIISLIGLSGCTSLDSVSGENDPLGRLVEREGDIPSSRPKWESVPTHQEPK